jgi:zinc protease
MKMTLLRFSLMLSLIFAVAPWIMGQEYDLRQMPALDPKVRTGVLENGIHYFIRVNKLPEKRGEFYIAHNVGAILEDDDQNGLAHFTEHMAFNGTENFPKKGILDYLATIGVKFGTNVNASTGLERTVYNLSNVPLIREGIIDTALLVLHDWSGYISFLPEEIDLERGVIREEWRMYGSASERMSNELAPVIYKGSKYALRNVIGDTAVINHFKYKTITDFYKKWYRPDLQAM